MNNTNVIALPASVNFTPMQAVQSMANFGEDDLKDVLCIGYDADGSLIIRSSRLTRAEALFLLKKAEQWVLDPESGS